MFFGDSEAYNFVSMVAAETEEKGATRGLAIMVREDIQRCPLLPLEAERRMTERLAAPQKQEDGGQGERAPAELRRAAVLATLPWWWPWTWSGGTPKGGGQSDALRQQDPGPRQLGKEGEGHSEGTHQLR